jgi:hypothetical protein
MAGSRDTRWKPGQSGNPRGRPKRTLFDGDLRAALKRNRGQRSKELVEALIEKAKSGDVSALKLVAERIAGKPRPSEIVQGTPDEKLTREQVQQRLAALLAHPEVKQNVQRILLSSGPGPSEKLQ